MSFSFEEFLELLQLPGVSGFEHRVREYIISRLRNLGLKPRIDALGNVIVELGNGNNTVLVTAHMDEVGLVVTYIEPDGRLRFRKIGGIDDRALVGQKVKIYSVTSTVDIEGVIGLQPPHLQLRKDSQLIPWYELYIDIGADSREEVISAGVTVPCPAVLDKRPLILMRGKAIAGRGIDNRAGCYVLLKLAELLAKESLHNLKIILAWTVQEEIGLRGAKALTATYRPTATFVLDTVSCCNPTITGDMRLGSGPVLRVLDNEYIASPLLVELVLQIAKSEKLPVQVATAGGATDAVELQEVNTHTLAIGIPVKYTHTSTELCYFSDVKMWINLIHSVLIHVDFSRLSQ